MQGRPPPHRSRLAERPAAALTLALEDRDPVRDQRLHFVAAAIAAEPAIVRHDLSSLSHCVFIAALHTPVVVVRGGAAQHLRAGRSAPWTCHPSHLLPLLHS